MTARAGLIQRASAACLLLLGLAHAAHAQLSLRGLDRDMAGPRSTVMVLGTVHLSELPESFNPAALDGLMDRLAAFKPDVITIEAMSGEECDTAARHPAKYGTDYCPPTDVARQATGLDVPAAMAEVARRLASWPARPAAAQRRQLAAFMLAANDRASAYAQWLQLPPDERRAGDGLDERLVQLLQQIATRRNENYLIASRLAARLGLARVHATDNHSGDDVRRTDDEAFGKAVMTAWTAARGELDAQEQQVKALSTAADLLPLYRHVNDTAYLRMGLRLNVQATLRGTSPQRYEQQWLAGWETRNLRMVANIREAFRETPGARVLSIVGAGHKVWFDEWLGQMQGVDIVDVRTVLK